MHITPSILTGPWEVGVISPFFLLESHNLQGEGWDLNLTPTSVLFSRMPTRGGRVYRKDLQLRL